MVQSKADILRATSRHEARHALGSGRSGSGLSRFVPSKATMLKGALGAAATAALAAGVAAGVHALSTYNPSFRDPNTYKGPRDKHGLPVFTPLGGPPVPAPSPKPDTAAPAATRVETDGEMSEGVSWFKDLFGFVDGPTTDPEYFASHKKKFTYNRDEGILALADQPTTTWQAGKFETPSLATLRTASKKTLLHNSKPTQTTVTFVPGDVAVLHGAPAYAGAVFQAASRFNCLEPFAPEYTPEDGVAIYANDKDQGPACAISCAPGTIVRSYFAFPGLYGAHGLYPQKHNHQVDTLRDVVASLTNEEPALSMSLATVENGFAITSNKKSLQRLNERVDKRGPRVQPTGAFSKAREDLMGLMKVGVQTNTQVTCTKLKTGKDQPWYKVSVPKDEAPLLVTQVYASALSVRHAVRGETTTKEECASFAQLVLDAAYEATLHATVIYATETNERKTVVLTALGGDSGNDTQWISAAIVRALKIFRDAGLDVVINESAAGDLGYIRAAIAADPETSQLLQPVAPAFGHRVRPVVMYTE
jgi:hypothetical protein